jgi:lysophospholipase L1-like esterase
MGPILGGAPRIKIDASLNLVCDGNSLTAGAGDNTAYPWPSGVKSRHPEAALATISNFAVSGQSVRGMINRAALVDAAWVDGKTNVLVIGMIGTNTICNEGCTAAQTLADVTEYNQGRLALHPWLIVAGTDLPRQTNAGQAQTTSQNAVIDAYNALLLANYKSIGMKGIFDVRRAGSNFNLPDYNNTSFEASMSAYGLLASNEVGNHIHLSGAGYSYLDTDFIFPAIKRLPAR